MPMPSSTWRCHARTASVGCKPRGCTVTCTVGIATRLRRQLARSAEAQHLKLHEHTGIDPCELSLYINGYFTLPHIVFQPIPNIYSRTELDSPRKKVGIKKCVMRKTTKMREAQTKNRTMDRPALHTPALPCNDCMRACACCCARMRALGPCASMCLHAHGSTCVCELVGMCKDSQTHLCMCADSSAFLCMCACMRATPCVCESMRNKHCGTCVWTARDGAMFFKPDTTE